MHDASQDADGTQLIRVRGYPLRVRVTGTGDPLLLLSGLTRPLESWASFSERMPGRTLITFDAPGVGMSRTPVLPLTMLQLSALAASVLDAVGHPAADVLGYSFGGAVAQQLAASAPHRVRRLMLVSTSCGVGAIPGAGPTLRNLRRPEDSATWPPVSALGTLWQSLAISSWSSIPLLGAIRAPTLVVGGLRDRLVPPANSTLLAQRIRGARLELIDAGHDLQRPVAATLLAGTVAPFLAVGAPSLA